MRDLTAREAYRHFAEWWDCRLVTSRSGVEQSGERFRFGGRVFSFGAATADERETLSWLEAAEFREAPARVLRFILDGERMLIKRRWWSKSGEAQAGSPREGATLGWVVCIAPETKGTL